MRVLMGGVLMAALVAGGSQAGAAERLSDAAFTNAMRCSGVASARGVDAAKLEAMLKDQKRGRQSHVTERAKQARRDAAREADRGLASRSAPSLEACSAYLPASDALSQRPAPTQG